MLWNAFIRLSIGALDISCVENTTGLKISTNNVTVLRVNIFFL